LDVPLGLVTISDVAYPQSADLKQPRDVTPQWVFKMSQIPGNPHPQALRQSEIINPHGTL